MKLTELVRVRVVVATNYHFWLGTWTKTVAARAEDPRVEGGATSNATIRRRRIDSKKQEFAWVDSKTAFRPISRSMQEILTRPIDSSWEYTDT